MAAEASRARQPAGQESRAGRLRGGNSAVAVRGLGGDVGKAGAVRVAGVAGSAARTGVASRRSRLNNGGLDARGGGTGRSGVLQWTCQLALIHTLIKIVTQHIPP